MTPATVLSLVRDQLVESTADYWQDAELYRYMSQAESEITTLTECCAKQSTVATTTTGTSGYTLPGDCLTVKRLTFDGVPLKQIDIRERDNLDMPGYGGTMQSGNPTHWYQFNGYAYMWPTPARAATYVYDYVYQPATIVTASSAFSVPLQFQNAIPDYVLYRAYVKDQDQAKSEFYKKEYMQAVMDTQMREQRRRWAGGFQAVRTEDASLSTYDGMV